MARVVVASFSGEHATKLELGALDGFTGTDPAVLAGNTLRLYHRALAANERLNMLTLLVSAAELVLGWIGWFPDENGEFVIATVGSAATNAAGIEIMLPASQRVRWSSRRWPTTGARPTSGPATIRPRSRTRRAPTPAVTAKRSRSASAPLSATA